MRVTLKAARVNKGLTQKEASEKIGVSEAMLCKWEKGTNFPSVKWIPAILSTYDVSYDDIIFLPNDYTLSVIR